MSPKSRGRPKGRGRDRRRAHRHHAERLPAATVAAAGSEAIQRVLLEATLLRAADAMMARTAASGWLGRAWASAPMGRREPEADLVADLVGLLGTEAADAAYRALQALELIARPPWAEKVTAALAAHGEAEPPGGRVASAPPRPVSARRYTDPFGTEIACLVRYADPEDHSLLVGYTTDFGVMADRVELGVQDGDAPPVAGLDGEAVDAEAALAEVAEVLETTDLYWPRVSDPSYSDLRALAHWYAGPFRREPAEPVSIGDEERLALIQDFLESRGRSRDDVDGQDGLLADLFVDFADGYLPGGVLAWSPGAVTRFMLDWVHRKALLDPEDLEALPEVLRAWVDFALGRKGLAREHIDQALAAVDDCTEDFEAQAADDDLAGPAKQLMMRAMEAGVDPSDREAMQGVVSAYNAELNARRLLGEPGP